MTYEEICEYIKIIEKNPNATEYDLVAVEVAKLQEELKLGIETGKSAEEVFSELLKEENIDNNSSSSKTGFATN